MHAISWVSYGWLQPFSYWSHFGASDFLTAQWSSISLYLPLNMSHQVFQASRNLQINTTFSCISITAWLNLRISTSDEPTIHPNDRKRLYWPVFSHKPGLRESSILKGIYKSSPKLRFRRFPNSGLGLRTKSRQLWAFFFRFRHKRFSL